MVAGIWLTVALSSVPLANAGPTGRLYSDNGKTCISCTYKTEVFANCQQSNGPGKNTNYWWCCNTASNKPGTGNAGGTWDKCTDAKTKKVAAPPRRRVGVVPVSTGPALKRVGAAPGKLKVCEGDCQRHDQCPGVSQCVQRTGGVPSVVYGCSAGDSGANPTTDYCSNPPAWNALRWTGANPILLQVCHGDCDTDAQCPGISKCQERTGGKPAVAGCTAGDSGTPARADTDYCTNPSVTRSSPPRRRTFTGISVAAKAAVAAVPAKAAVPGRAADTYYKGGLACYDLRGKCRVLKGMDDAPANGAFHPQPTALPVVKLLLGGWAKAAVTAHYYPGCSLQGKDVPILGTSKAAVAGQGWLDTLQRTAITRAKGSDATGNGVFCPGTTKCYPKLTGFKPTTGGMWFVQLKKPYQIAKGDKPGLGRLPGIFCSGCTLVAEAWKAPSDGWVWASIMGSPSKVVKDATVAYGSMFCPEGSTANPPSPNPVPSPNPAPSPNPTPVAAAATCVAPVRASFAGGLGCYNWGGRCAVIAKDAKAASTGTFHPQPKPILAVANTKAGYSAHYYPGCSVQGKDVLILGTSKAAVAGQGWLDTLQALPIARAKGSDATGNGVFCPGTTKCYPKSKGGLAKSNGMWFEQRIAATAVKKDAVPGYGVFCSGCSLTGATTAKAGQGGYAWGNIMDPHPVKYDKDATVPKGVMWCPSTNKQTAGKVVRETLTLTVVDDAKLIANADAMKSIKIQVCKAYTDRLAATACETFIRKASGDGKSVVATPSLKGVSLADVQAFGPDRVDIVAAVKATTQVEKVLMGNNKLCNLGITTQTGLAEVDDKPLAGSENSSGASRTGVVLATAAAVVAALVQ